MLESDVHPPTWFCGDYVRPGGIARRGGGGGGARRGGDDAVHAAERVHPLDSPPQVEFISGVFPLGLAINITKIRYIQQ